MTKKIITKIESSTITDFGSSSSKTFYFTVAPFNYKHEGTDNRVAGIFIKGGNKNIYQPFISEFAKSKIVEIEFDESNVEGVGGISEGSSILSVRCLRIKGDVAIKNYGEKFTFKLLGKREWKSTPNLNLDLTIQKSSLKEGCLTPLISKITINCGNECYGSAEENRKKLFNSLQENEEYFIEDWSGVKFSDDGTLSFDSSTGSDKIKKTTQPSPTPAPTPPLSSHDEIKNLVASIHRKNNHYDGGYKYGEAKTLLEQLLALKKKYPTEWLTAFNGESEAKSLINKGNFSAEEKAKYYSELTGKLEKPAPNPNKHQDTSDHEKYNDLYIKNNHPVIKEYEELKERIFYNVIRFNIYKKANNKLLDEIWEKCGKAEPFRSLWPSDSVEKRIEVKDFNNEEVTKRTELINLMKSLVSSTPMPKEDAPNNPKPNDDQKQKAPEKPVDDLPQIRKNSIQLINDSLKQAPVITTSELETRNRNWESEINQSDKERIQSIVSWTLSDISNKRDSKKKSTEINASLQLEGNETQEQLEEKFKKIERESGEELSDENKTKKAKLETELAKKDPQKFKDIVIQTIKESMAKFGVSLEDLKEKGKELMNKLTSASISNNDSNIEKICQAKEEMNKIVGETGSDKILTNFLTNFKNALTSKKESLITEWKRKIIEFATSTNVYEKSIYQSRKLEVESVLNSVSDNNKQNNPNKLPSWLIPVAAITGLTVLGVLLVVVLKSKRAKQRPKTIK